MVLTGPLCRVDVHRLLQLSRGPSRSKCAARLDVIVGVGVGVGVVVVVVVRVDDAVDLVAPLVDDSPTTHRHARPTDGGSELAPLSWRGLRDNCRESRSLI